MANPSERIGGPVIGAQYCVPSTCQYKLFQTRRGSKNWSVVDAAKGTVIFTLVKHKTNSSRWIPKYETQLVDAQGNIIARIQEKGSRWKVLGGSADSSVLCSVKTSGGLLAWKTTMKVFLASNLSEKQPDYMVELRTICASDCIILHGTQPMSEVEVNRRWFGRPEYTVTVNAGADCAFVLLLVMIMEKKREQRAAAATNANAGAAAASAGAAGGGF
ncbi:hypothetical protein BDL97_05G097900 [Sphagnum fallax]|nr:hypothetical protein BDL97_05G097900 [Sphagnum fallax]KAH8962358.1 hypothetical protein BDL97_05G097900 [Sphagnum fallax]